MTGQPFVRNQVERPASLLLRGAPGAERNPGASPADASSDREPDEELLCAACGAAVTKPRWATAADGAHEHVFCNPAGQTFEIALYSTAPGVLCASAAFSAFSWFPGCVWRIGVCRGCSLHLGWRFDSDSDSFYGLIRPRLVLQSGRK